jgi:hypothetical protein
LAVGPSKLPICHMGSLGYLLFLGFHLNIVIMFPREKDLALPGNEPPPPPNLDASQAGLSSLLGLQISFCQELVSLCTTQVCSKPAWAALSSHGLGDTQDMKAHGSAWRRVYVHVPNCY